MDRQEYAVVRTVEAVYEQGALRPLEPLDLAEGQRVRLQLEVEDPIELAGRVYDGLPDKEVTEIERIALDRRGWHRE